MKKILSIFLLILLSFPSFIGLHHLVNEDHTLCNEQKVHLHEQELDCFTCEYIRISFDYNFNFGRRCTSYPNKINNNLTNLGVY